MRIKSQKYLSIAFLAILLAWFTRMDIQKLDAAPSNRFIRYGIASWYSKESPGINPRTANNEIFNDEALTCAIWGVQFGRLIRVTNLKNHKSIVVRVNDRGPHEMFIRRGRIIDLTKEAFSRINPSGHGIIPVQIEFL